MNIAALSKFLVIMDHNVMNKAPAFKKTRFAPTPSGYLHLGNILSFAITAYLAKQRGAGILLRIDDFDRERTVEKYVQDIFDTLNFMEIPWDEGPRNFSQYEREYSQVHRTEMYQKALQALRGAGNVFACDCSRSKIAAINADSRYPGTCRNRGLSLDADNVSWRLFTGECEIAVKTIDGRLIHKLFPAGMNDFIVRKKDGLASYQLTSVLDDQYFGVDLVVRGEDLWPSTLAQICLSGFLPGNSFEDTAFYHHHLLMDNTGEKLSKSEGAVSVQYLRKEGKTSAEVYTLIGKMLGSNTPVENFYQLAELVLK